MYNKEPSVTIGLLEINADDEPWMAVQEVVPPEVEVPVLESVV